MSETRRRRALIIGGSGQLGVAIAEAMNVCGWSVTTAQRDPSRFPAHLLNEGIQIEKVDRLDRRAMRDIISGGFDAVIDTICYTAKDADALLDLQSNIGNMIVFSSASVYCDHKGRTLDEAKANGFPSFDGPIAISQSTVAAGLNTYSTNKIAMEERLLNESRIPVSILRPTAIHGAHSHHPREWWFVKRILDGRRRIPLRDFGRNRFQTSAASNLADLVIATLDNPGTRILNAADANAPNVLEIGHAIASALGQSTEFAPFKGNSDSGFVGATPWSTRSPFVLDMSDAEKIGYKPKCTYEESVKSIVNWLAEFGCENAWETAFPALASYGWDLFDYAAEDELLATLPS